MQLEVKRRLDADDIASVAVLLETVEKADGIAPLGEEQWLALVAGGTPQFVAVLGREGKMARPIAYGQATRGHDRWDMELVVEPAHRGQGLAVGAQVLGAVLREVARHGGGKVQLWVRRPTDDHDRIAAAASLRGRRDVLQLFRPLPAEPPPPGFVTRAFEPGRDEQAWLAVNNRAFRGHPEQSGWEMATLLAREQQPWFDPDGFRLHERDGRLAGFCWTKVHADHVPPLGEIYVIGVDPDFGGQGLGRALVLDGLASLAARGLGDAMLYVEGDNDTALRLYEALGFTIDHVDRAYLGDVRKTSGDVDADR